MLRTSAFYSEFLLLSGLFCLTLLFILNPFNILTTLYISFLFVALLITLYLIKFFVIWKSSGYDERDREHRLYASWVSYAVTSVLLFTGIVVEAFAGKIDFWLLVTFLGLIGSKLLALLYLKLYK